MFLKLSMEIYEPREDSFLLLKEVGKFAKGRVLDMGTGTGILAEEAAKKAEHVLAADINKKAINYCKKNIKNKKIKFVVSDLFSNVKGKFDLIIFNPPYLPADPRVKDLTIDGGKKGHEIIEKFLNTIHHYLYSSGKILLVFSSLTGKEKVKDIIKKEDFNYKELSKQKLYFEELYVYLISEDGEKRLFKNSIDRLRDFYFTKLCSSQQH